MTKTDHETMHSSKLIQYSETLYIVLHSNYYVSLLTSVNVLLVSHCMFNGSVFLFFSFLTGHVFPEFKESDAMFAAERVRYFVFLVSLK